jgi:DNA-binding GntR family transcriptional regulator
VESIESGEEELAAQLLREHAEQAGHLIAAVLEKTD